MSNYKEQILKEMGIPLWRTRGKELSGVAREVSEKFECWDKVAEDANACASCTLHLTRNSVVVGKGSKEADLLIVGEAPGAEEDKQGLPFVGKAGILLDQMMLSCSEYFGEVYVVNVIKCRPPGNRTPEKIEIDSCLGFLLRQIRLLSPKGILALGRTAAHTLLNSDASLAKLRGKVHYDGIVEIPVVVTYHPAYLLRSPLEKAKSWEDLNLLKTIFGDVN